MLLTSSREENAKERVKQQVKESKTHLKESVALTERLRAAQVRQGLVTFYDTGGLVIKSYL